MIEFRNVYAGYSENLPVLEDVSFVINKGEFVSFVGTNGAGKSTTMRLMNGLLVPSSGEVLIEGRSTKEVKTSQLAQTMGFLFQNPDRQICCNTVREELLFGFKALNADLDEAYGRVDDIIERFGFEPAAEPFLLNRGTRQLLALASIIVLNPDVVILDEPTTGLDYKECMQVMNIVREMNKQGTTVVMVCHDMEVVADFAHRIIAMTEGRVVDDGPTFEVLRNKKTLKKAHLIPPQIVDISMALPLLNSRLADTPVALANTVESMCEAVKAMKGGKA